MKINRGDILYFLGIGGIGMSALARWCHSLGAQIYGYDLQQTRLTMELEDEGMKIHYDIDVSRIPDNVVYAIYTPAVPQDNSELAFFYNSKIPLLKRSEFLGDITRDYFTIAIAGTHGKTTTSVMLSHILKNSNFSSLGKFLLNVLVLFAKSKSVVKIFTSCFLLPNCSAMSVHRNSIPPN